jgi:hypothetical protein
MAPPCWFHMKGRCKFGDSCRFAHTKPQPSRTSKVALRYKAATRTVSKSILYKKRREVSIDRRWTRDKAGDFMQYQEPVEHLDWSNKSALATKSYMVTPKANGERMMLFCERVTGNVYLIGSNDAMMDPVMVEEKTNTIHGFVLGVEKVCNPAGERLIVAFDVLAIDYAAACLLSGFQAIHWIPSSCNDEWVFEAIHPGVNIVPNNLEQRHDILNRIVEAMSIPGLLTKPLWHTTLSLQTVWSFSQSLSYPVDGLVFTPARIIEEPGSRADKCAFKWKPTNMLTVDVAVGGKVESELNHRSRFIPYLWERYSHPRIVTHEKNVTHAYHSAFAIVQLHDNGKYKIASIPWPEPREAGEDGEARILQREQAPSPPSLWIPDSDSTWAAHNIVEALFDAQTNTLHYQRIRRDRRSANTFEQARAILKLQAKPLQLSDLTFQELNEKEPEKSAPNRLIPYRTAMARQSKFQRMRSHHHTIKALLFNIFGGRTVVDACCGGLNDYHSLVESGSKFILGIEQDAELVELGFERLLSSNKHISHANATLVQADLSRPLDRSRIPHFPAADERDKPPRYRRVTLGCLEDQHRENDIPQVDGSVDAVFCNFALHYFWNTKEHTSLFLGNLVPFLRDRGLFIVTYMRPDVVRSKKRVQILNADKEVEFEANLQPNNRADVFVASIGKTHSESLIDEDEMMDRFSKAGMDHLVTYPFDQLRQMLPYGYSSIGMTDAEVEMSSFYAASVFQRISHGSRDAEPDIGLLGALPTTTLNEVLSFLDVKELAKLRFTSELFRKKVDNLGISEQYSCYFRSMTKPVLYTNKDSDGLIGPLCVDSKGEKKMELTPCSIAAFIRLGGEFLSLERDDAKSNETFSDGGFGYGGFGRFDDDSY